MKINLNIQNTIHTQPFLSNLEKLSIIITDSNNADFHVKQADLISDRDLEGRKKIIALEKRDGGGIAKREILAHDNIIRYVKQYSYRSVDDFNKACIGDRLFVRYLSKCESWKHYDTPVSQSDLSKIFLGWNFLHYAKMEDYIANCVDFGRPRSIDVFFAGSTHYTSLSNSSGDLISKHRINCVQTLKGIKNINKLIIDGRLLNRKDYFHAIRNSKIVISPWGWGEACYRDYEAILSGAIVIKPDTSFVCSSCGIFQKSFVTWCDPYFYDLESKIVRALDLFESSRMERIYKRDCLLKQKQRLPYLIRSIFEF